MPRLKPPVSCYRKRLSSSSDLLTGGAFDQCGRVSVDGGTFLSGLRKCLFFLILFALSVLRILCIYKFQHDLKVHAHLGPTQFLFPFLVIGTNMTGHCFICIHSVHKRLLEQERSYGEGESQIWLSAGRLHLTVSYLDT